MNEPGHRSSDDPRGASRIAQEVVEGIFHPDRKAVWRCALPRADAKRSDFDVGGLYEHIPDMVNRMPLATMPAHQSHLNLIRELGKRKAEHGGSTWDDSCPRL